MYSGQFRRGDGELQFRRFHYWDFVERFPGVDERNLVADRLFVIDRRRITCSGGRASIDVAAAILLVYCSDISRTWLAGDGRPSDEQRKLYEYAYAQVHFNMELLRPG